MQRNGKRWKLDLHSTVKNTGNGQYMSKYENFFKVLIHCVELEIGLGSHTC
jgi:hypothetical protein